MDNIITCHRLKQLYSAWIKQLDSVTHLSSAQTLNQNGMYVCMYVCVAVTQILQVK